MLFKRLAATHLNYFRQKGLSSGLVLLFSVLFMACTGPQETKVDSGFLGGIYLSVENSAVSLGAGAASASSSSVSTGNTIDCVVTLKDQNGNRFVSPDPVTVEFYTEGGTSTGTFSTVVDNHDGTYTSTFTATTAGTASNIKARINGQSVASSNTPQITVAAGNYSLSNSLVSVSAATVTAGNSITVTMTAKDSSNNALTSGGLTVVFFEQAGGTSHGAFSAVTDNGNGTYTATWQGQTAGTAVSIGAKINTQNLTSTYPTATVNPGAATSLAVSGFTSPATSATSYSFTVTAKDAYNNTATGYTGIVAFTSSAATKSLPANYTFVSGDNGTHTFSGSITTAGTQSITATDTVTASITGSQTGIIVNPVVNFSVASQDVAINQGTATITASLNTAAASTVTIPLTTNFGSTAVNNTDYTLSATSISIASGSSSGSITVTIIDQKTPAFINATLTLDLGTITNGVAGSTTSSHTMTIRSPTLDLNFAEIYDPVTQFAQAPYSGITFTRASTATYMDCDGVLKTAAANVPRIECDPVTGQPKGLLVEESRTNLATYSSVYSNSAWSKSQASVSVSTVLAPDGTKSVSKLVEDTSNNYHFITQNFNATSGTSYCISTFMKSAERTKFYVEFNNAAGFNWQTAFFNLSTGTVFQTSNSPTASGITNIGNGWYRGYVCATATSTATATAYIVMINSTSSPWQYTGDGSSGAYLWGTQIEAGSYPTSYIPTGNASVTRSQDLAQMNSISGWFTSAQGSLAADFYSISGSIFGANQNAIEIDDGTFNNRHTLARTTGDNTFWRVMNTGASQAGLQSTSSYSGTQEARIANAYQVNDFAQTTSNSTSEINTSSSGTPPSGLTTAWLGSYGGGSQINNSLKRFSFYQRRLPNTVLLTLSNTSNYFRTYTPTVNLTSTTQTVLDSTGTVYVTAALSEPARSALTVPYTVSGTAVSGTNYSGLSSGNFSFAAGEQRKTISFTLLDDGGSTNPTIIISLGTGTGFTLGSNMNQTITILRPTLDLNFASVYDPSSQASTAPLNQLTFTRASTATYMDCDGIIKTAATNVPRIECDPVTGQPKGLLVENARTNLVTYSGNMSSNWSLGNASKSSTTIVGPDGTKNVIKLIENTSNSSHILYQSRTGSNETLTFSIYAKAAERTKALTQLSNFSTFAVSAGFDLTNCTVSSAPTSNADYTSPSASAVSVGNGWCRLILTATKGNANTVNNPVVQTINSAGTNTYTGDGSSGIYIWGAQLETGSYPSSYIPTTTATVTRSADVPSASTGAWFNSSQGTALSTFNKPIIAGSGAAFPFDFDDGGSNNRMGLYIDNSTSYLVSSVYVSGSLNWQTTTPNTVTANSTTRGVLGYKTNDCAASLNAIGLISSSSCSIPTVNLLQLGRYSTGGGYFDGSIQRLTYYNQRLDNNTLQRLSAATQYSPRAYTPAVTLTKSSQVLMKNVGTAYVLAALSEVPMSTVTVPYTVSGTAVSGTDYTGLASGTLTFSAGNSRALISFPVTNNTSTGNKTVIITLGAPTGATLGTYSAQTVYLVDTVNGLTITTASQTTNTNTVTFSGTCAPGSTITISGTESSSTTCTAGGTWSWTSSSQSSNGTYSYTFTFTDPFGNSISQTGTWIRDTSAPNTVTGFLDGNTTSSLSSAPAFTWSATTDVGSAGLSYYQLAVGTTAGGTDILSWTSVGNVVTYTLSGLSLSNGITYYGSIRAVDAAGNISSVTQGDGFSVITNSPTLNLDFTTGTLPIEVQFSRSSGANVVAGTYFNSSGVLVSAPKNSLTYSQDFSNAVWNKSNVTVTADATTAPDGSLTADKVIPNSTLGVHYISQLVSMTSGETWCGSYYIKGGEYSHVQIVNGNTAYASNYQRARYNLSTGSLVSTGGSPTVYGLVSLSNSWYRIYMCSTASATGTGAIFLQAFDNSDNNSFSGNGSDGFYAWGGQLELASSPSSYIYTNTTTAYGPRFDYDPSTLSLKGLLIEGQRTNSITYSGDLSNAAWVQWNSISVTGNTTATLDGTTTAATLSEANAGATSNIDSNNVTVANSQTWTGSLYVKKDSTTSRFPLLQLAFTGGTTSLWFGASFNTQTGAVSATGSATSSTVGVQDVGTYWRVWVTGANNATGNTTLKLQVFPANGTSIGGFQNAATGSIIAWGAQLEQGATPTSYIPTTSAAQIRTADIAKVSTSNGTWFNSSTGTIYGKSVMNTYVNNQFVFDINDTTSNNRIGSYVDSTGKHHTEVSSSGSGVFSPLYSAMSSGYTGQVAMTYANNDFASSANGATVQTSSSGAVPTVTQLQIGNYNNGTAFSLGGWIQSVKYYNSRLTNSQIKYMTAP